MILNETLSARKSPRCKVLLMIGLLIKKTMMKFIQDRAFRLAAAVAFYTAFSIAPLLVISVALVSLIFGDDAVEGSLKQELVGTVGNVGAEALEALISAAQREQSSGTLSSILGTLALIFGATGVFVELKDSMNMIWGIYEEPGSALGNLVRDRLLSFAMVLFIAFLLLASMVLTTMLTALSGHLAIASPSNHSIAFGVSGLISAALFMLIMKCLPDARVLWRDACVGGLATAVLFSLGKLLLAYYLGRVAITSAYGAAGAILVFLLWIYYSSVILFFGAEFTQVYSQMRASRS